MVTLFPNGNIVGVSVDEAPIGSIRLHDNPYHAQNCYVELHLDRLDKTVSKELFAHLAQIAKRPLQAMVDSDDAETVDFLTAGGFVCKRKCYEVEAWKEDWLGAPAHSPLLFTQNGENAYDRCCQMMYAHYIESHRAVSPWTAELSDFCKALPGQAVYQTDGRIINLAFVEGGEIAYLYNADRSRFSAFAASLVHWLFSNHDTICFESDDCDWAAMELRSMFANQDENSFDTYIYE